MRMRLPRVETTAAEVAHGPDGLTPDLLHCCTRSPCHLTSAYYTHREVVQDRSTFGWQGSFGAGFCQGSRMQGITLKVASVIAQSSPVTAARVAPRQADAGLEGHLATLLSARIAMRAELCSPPAIMRQRVAQRQLLRALERYVAAVAARGMPIPPGLRDELRLQQQVAGAR